MNLIRFYKFGLVKQNARREWRITGLSDDKSVLDVSADNYHQVVELMYMHELGTEVLSICNGREQVVDTSGT